MLFIFSSAEAFFYFFVRPFGFCHSSRHPRSRRNWWWTRSNRAWSAWQRRTCLGSARLPRLDVSPLLGYYIFIHIVVKNIYIYAMVIIMVIIMVCTMVNLTYSILNYYVQKKPKSWYILYYYITICYYITIVCSLRFPRSADRTGARRLECGQHHDRCAGHVGRWWRCAVEESA